MSDRSFFILPHPNRSYKLPNPLHGPHVVDIFRLDTSQRKRWRKIDLGYESQCWQATAATAAAYGKRYATVAVSVSGRRRYMQLHRALYQAMHGQLDEGVVLDHLCRNPVCCNPEHLEPVTNAVNIQRGANAKLTSEKVVAIRADPRSNKEVAEEYGVTAQTIYCVRRRISWKNVA